MDLSTDESTTLGGHVYFTSARVPKVSEETVVDGVEIAMLPPCDRRKRRVRVVKDE